MRTQMKITEITENEYRVESASGSTYTVTYDGSGDADPDFVAIWNCTCPAGEHGRTCKHVRAVGELTNWLIDYGQITLSGLRDEMEKIGVEFELLESSLNRLDPETV